MTHQVREHMRANQRNAVGCSKVRFFCEWTEGLDSPGVVWFQTSDYCRMISGCEREKYVNQT